MANRITYVEILDKYFNGELEDNSLIIMLGTKGIILRNLQKYLLKRPDKVNEVNDAIEHIDDILTKELTFDNLLKILEYKNNLNFYDAYEIAHDLLQMSKEDGIKYLNRRQINEKKCLSTKKSLSNKFPNQKEIIEVISVIEEYEEKYLFKEKSHNTYVNKKLCTVSNNEYYNALLPLLNTSYSIEDYCSITGERINTFLTPCYKLKHCQNEEFLRAIDEVNSRDNSTTMNLVKELVYEYLKADEIDMFDYYNKTKLHPDDFRTLFKRLTSDPAIIKNVSRKLSVQTSKMHSVNKEAEINSKSIILGREISGDTKAKIFEYLEENNYPTELYLIALRKYAKGDLEINKTLIKK